MTDLTDPLTGIRPTWRTPREASPIYLDVIADLGIPGLPEPAGPAPVVTGTVIPQEREP